MNNLSESFLIFLESERIDTNDFDSFLEHLNYEQLDSLEKRLEEQYINLHRDEMLDEGKANLAKDMSRGLKVIWNRISIAIRNLIKRRKIIAAKIKRTEMSNLRTTLKAKDKELAALLKSKRSMLQIVKEKGRAQIEKAKDAVVTRVAKHAPDFSKSG